MTTDELLDPGAPLATIEQVRESMEACFSLAEVIRKCGSVPAGHLYAGCLDRMSLTMFNRYITTLARAGLVKRDAFDLLVWIGPTFKPNGSA